MYGPIEWRICPSQVQKYNYAVLFLVSKKMIIVAEKIFQGILWKIAIFMKAASK